MIRQKTFVNGGIRTGAISNQARTLAGIRMPNGSGPGKTQGVGRIANMAQARDRRGTRNAIETNT